MESSGIIEPDSWRIAEMEHQLVSMARNGQRDSPEYESLLDQVLALKEIQDSEPGRL